jgi:cold shock CspA family protein
MKPGLRSGKLTKWRDERGFGFIQPVDGSQEVFLHIAEVKGATRRPQENDTIYYHCVVDSDGKVRACNAFILGARNKSASSSNRANPSDSIVSSFPIVSSQ